MKPKSFSDLSAISAELAAASDRLNNLIAAARMLQAAVSQAIMAAQTPVYRAGQMNQNYFSGHGHGPYMSPSLDQAVNQQYNIPSLAEVRDINKSIEIVGVQLDWLFGQGSAPGQNEAASGEEPPQPTQKTDGTFIEFPGLRMRQYYPPRTAGATQSMHRTEKRADKVDPDAPFDFYVKSITYVDSKKLNGDCMIGTESGVYYYSESNKTFMKLFDDEVRKSYADLCQKRQQAGLGPKAPDQRKPNGYADLLGSVNSVFSFDNPIKMTRPAYESAQIFQSVYDFRSFDPAEMTRPCFVVFPATGHYPEIVFHFNPRTKKASPIEFVEIMDEALKPVVTENPTVETVVLFVRSNPINMTEGDLRRAEKESVPFYDKEDFDAMVTKAYSEKGADGLAEIGACFISWPENGSVGKSPACHAQAPVYYFTPETSTATLVHFGAIGTNAQLEDVVDPDATVKHVVQEVIFQRDPVIEMTSAECQKRQQESTPMYNMSVFNKLISLGEFDSTWKCFVVTETEGADVQEVFSYDAATNVATLIRFTDFK